MAWISSGDGDVNYTGVVGSSGGRDEDAATHDRGDTGGANEGIIHAGRGEVRVNDQRQS